MLLTSLSLIVLLVTFFHQTEVRFYKEFTRQTAELSKAVQIGLEGSLAGTQADPLNLETYLSELDPRGVQEVSVISSATNRIVASTRPENIGKLITSDHRDMIFRADLGEPVTGRGQLFNVIVPVAAVDGSAGYIHLALTTEDFSVLLRMSALQKVLAALVVIGLGAGLAVVLARRYSRPIEEMATAALSVAAGDLDHTLPVDRKDEIGQLARSFDHMIARLGEDRLLRERLRAAEHLASTGQFASMVAHEIKNPLNFISLSIDHIRDTCRPVDPGATGAFESLVTNLKGEIGRIGRFAESFLEYGRPFELHLTPCDLDKVLGEVLELAAARAEAAGVRIVRETGELPTLSADPEFLRTCLLNIVKNALEAMPEGGSLTVGGSVGAEEVSLWFADTGPGVAPENLERLFTPLFSTKKGGLGLGLALTRRVIEEHSGSVLFQSRQGEGSTVTLTLPRGGEGA